MRSAFEQIAVAKRESAEALIKAEHGDAAVETVCSFSHLDCVIDVKLEGESQWWRYILIDNDDEADALRRIG